MGCGCGGGAGGNASSRYQVKVAGRIVYESTSEAAARSVKARYAEADLIGPDGATIQ